MTAPTASGDLRIYPAGSALPTASAINYVAGNTRANNGNYALGSNGGLTVHCDQSSGTVHFIIDVTGYFETAVPPPPASSRWSRRYGDVWEDRGEAVALDGQNRVAVTGSFMGTADFGGGAASSHLSASGSPTKDIFVAGYAPSGGYLWSRAIGSDSDEGGNSVATDGAGNVLVTGYQGSYAVDYGGGPQFLRAGMDIFVAKYSAAGSWVWSKTVGGSLNDQGMGIAADAGGNVFVTGYFGVSSTGVNFGGGALFSAGQADVFLVKYSATGAHVWSKRFGSTGNDVGMAVAVDPAGNVYVAGTFESSVNLGGGVLSSAGMRDIFSAKYSAAGAHVWSKRFGSSGDDLSYRLTVDSAGDVALAGKFQGSVSFGGTALTSAGGDDAFLVKLSGGSGAQLWAKRFGSTSGDVASGVAVDGSDNVVVSGYFAGAVDFGGGALSSVGTDVFAAKYSSSGVHLWSRRFGGADVQIGGGVAAATNGDVTLTGSFRGTIDFGMGLLSSVGGNDGFIAAIGP